VKWSSSNTGIDVLLNIDAWNLATSGIGLLPKT
jgi:hypothetical protein